MLYSIKRGLVIAAFFAMALVPNTASADPVPPQTDQEIQLADLTLEYQETWDEVKEKEVGPYDGLAGRNIAEDGVEPRPNAAARPATVEELREGIGVMQNMLHPVVTETVTDTTTTVSTTPAPTTGGSGCTGMEAESGSLGYAEPLGGTSPGYIGCYQIDYELHYNGGVCTGMDTSPSGQDSCAAAICESQGSGAWTNGAGANPC